MKKRLITIIISLMMVVSLVACGSTDSTKIQELEDKIEELEAEIEELEEENEELRERQEEKVAGEQNEWEDDYIFAWTDKKFREEIINLIGITERDITYGDVKNLRELECFSYFDNIDSLIYFTSLEYLSIQSSTNNVEAIGNLENLEKLNLSTNATDYYVFSKLTNLKYLNLSCPKEADLSFLDNLHSLQYVRINGEIILDNGENPFGIPVEAAAEAP